MTCHFIGRMKTVIKMRNFCQTGQIRYKLHLISQWNSPCCGGNVYMYELDGIQKPFSYQILFRICKWKWRISFHKSVYLLLLIFFLPFLCEVMQTGTPFLFNVSREWTFPLFIRLKNILNWISFYFHILTETC